MCKQQVACNSMKHSTPNTHVVYQVGPHGSAVERQSLATILSPSCAQPVADG